jgi:hypothetical protein
MRSVFLFFLDEMSSTKAQLNITQWMESILFLIGFKQTLTVLE